MRYWKHFLICLLQYQGVPSTNLDTADKELQAFTTLMNWLTMDADEILQGAQEPVQDRQAEFLVSHISVQYRATLARKNILMNYLLNLKIYSSCYFFHKIYIIKWCYFTKVIGKSVCSSCYPSMVDPLSYLLFQPVLHDWCNKSCGVCCPVSGMLHIKEPLLLIEKSSPCSGSSRFPLSLSGPLPYVRCHITIIK